MTEEPSGPPAFHAGLYEVHLPVRSVARSVQFYVEKLGFRVGTTDGDRGALLRYARDGTRWMLGLFRVDEVVHRHPAEYHVALRVPEQQVDRMIGYLRDRDIEPLHPVHAPLQGVMGEPIVHGWMPAAAVFFRDPDGHLLELVAELDEEPRPDFVYRTLTEWREEAPGHRAPVGR
ncbi:MAG TPA: VOC family protein [Longimicrobiales bacterium]|nr:VOC family protein [Longimicrobiales bacterium]